ncbi:unnamed protein product [Dibothriocephalus latus]|uniref:S1 motif domain-containing protein n=1 Tax=Dibothriocephalus latus TaxID=60516 RepID=A0A3P7KZ75_DIBLA|nr:unnamed protein product [Dibothriocephalus latus]
MDDLGLLKPICLFDKLFNHKLRLNDSVANQFAGFTVSKDVISTAAGSAMVTVGATRVLCGIKVKVMPTLKLESPFICSVEQTNLSQRLLRTNKPVSKDIQSLSVQLDWILRTCAIPDAKDQLQIYFAATDADPSLKKMVCGMYLLHIDLLILHDDGCLLDACLAAVLAALSCAEWSRLEGKAGASVGQVATQTMNTSKMNFQEVATSQSPVRLHATLFHIILDSEGAIVDFAMVGGLSSCLWAHLEEAGICHNRAVLPELLDRAAKQCDVVSVKDFGAFVTIEGSTRQGLVHRSQISNHRIDDASEVLEVGEEVFCKIISDEDGKIGLSMKFVNQTSGDDKDPNNVLAAQQAKRRSGPGREQVPIRLEAELNTLCTRCKGKGRWTFF